MKISRLLFTGLLCAGLFACSNDDYEAQQDSEEGTGYMSLVITDKSRSNTRTLTPEEAAEDYEQKITEALVVMDYVAEGSSFPENWTPRVRMRDIVSVVENEDGDLYTTTFLVQPGTYRVWVVGNPTEAIKNNPVGMDPRSGVVGGALPNSIEGVSPTVDDVIAYASNGATKNKFIMFNACNSETEFDAGANYVEIVVTDEHTKTNPATNASNPIKLERLAARIDSRVKADAAGEIDITIDGVEDEYPGQNPDITISYEGAVLLNGARQANLVQHWDGDKLAYTIDANFSSPNNTETNLSHYWSIQRYRGMSGAGELATIFKTNLNPNYSDDEPAQFYCLENKPAINATMANRSTGLIHKFVLTDNAKVDDEDTNFYLFCLDGLFYRTQDELVNRTVIYYRNHLLELTDYAVKEITPILLAKEYTQADIDKLIATGRPGEDTVLAEDVEAAIKEAVEAGLTALTAGNTAHFHDVWHIKTYWEGAMYYTYYIKDSNYDEVAVYRNTIYKLKVTELGSIGNYLPEVTTDQKQYMQVQVEVVDWVVSEDDNITLN